MQSVTHIGIAVLVVSASWTTAQAGAAITEGLLLLSPPTTTQGPVERDPVLSAIANNSLATPAAGGTVTGLQNSPLQWVPVAADDYGRFSTPAGSWLAVTLDAAQDGLHLLQCNGHDLALVNGLPHMGMTAAPGIHEVPVELHAGSNRVLVRSNGELIRIKIKNVTPDNAITISQYDVTTPQLYDLEMVDEVAAVLVVNATDQPLNGLDIATFTRFTPPEQLVPRIYPELPPTQWIVDPMVSVPARSMRKVPLRIIGPPPFKVAGLPYPVDIEIRTPNGEVLSAGVINLGTRYRTDMIKRTWLSKLDGSVQSCVLIPPPDAAKPEGTDGLLMALTPLVKSPHGTARAYQPADHRMTMVPVNRRTGIANTPLGRADAMEAMDHIMRDYPIDPSRRWVSGFADAGLAAWELAKAHPDQFAAVMPIGTRIDSTQSHDQLRDMHVRIRWGANDQTIPAGTQEQLTTTLTPSVGNLQVDVVADEGHWWGRDTLAPDDLSAFLDAATLSLTSTATPQPERDGFDRVLEGPLTLVYGTKGTPEQTLALANKARFDQEQLWSAANAGATVVSDTAFDPQMNPCHNVILYGSADTNTQWSSLAGTSSMQVTTAGITISGSHRTGDDLVAVLVHTSPLCESALVGVVAPTGNAAHRMLSAIPICQPGRQTARERVLDLSMLRDQVPAVAAGN